MTTENSTSKNTIAAVVALVLFIGSFIYLAVEMTKNKALQDGFISEKLAAESLLSEKLQLEKEISKMGGEFTILQRKNAELDKALLATSRQLDAASLDLRKAQKQDVSVTQLMKQNKELLKRIEGVDQEIADYRISQEQLQILNNDLEVAITLLQGQNKDLMEELNNMRLSPMNQILTESTKKNNKLTVRAARTKNLIVNIDVPAHAENLNFKITNPSGKELTEKEGTIAINTMMHNKPGSKAFYVAGTSVSPTLYNQVQMIYVAKARLTPGTYNIEVVNNSISLGSLKVKLR